jgi:very-short-patch-repair endonuclease
MKLIYNRNLRSLAQDLRKSGNLSEVLLWNQIKAKKLGVQFLRQKPIDKYIIDFYCNELNLAIEIDGVSHDAKVDEDIFRQNMLESKGIRFLRFSDTDVKCNLESVVSELKEFIKNSLHTKINKNPSAC